MLYLDVGLLLRYFLELARPVSDDFDVKRDRVLEGRGRDRDRVPLVERDLRHADERELPGLVPEVILRELDLNHVRRQHLDLAVLRRVLVPLDDKEPSARRGGVKERR